MDGGDVDVVLGRLSTLLEDKMELVERSILLKTSLEIPIDITSLLILLSSINFVLSKFI